MVFELPFLVNAFVLLGIERILYSFWFIYPQCFIAAVRQGTFGNEIRKEPLIWKAAQKLGVKVKVFQFSVIIYDLIVQCVINKSEFNVDLPVLLLGIFLIVIGQGLNVAVFNALGGIGVYYGYEFGYAVKMVTCFPYNVSWISDPQYIGVVMTIWGIYLVAGATDFSVPLLETFWYGMSMKVLEHNRGRNFVRSIYGEDNPKTV